MNVQSREARHSSRSSFAAVVSGNVVAMAVSMVASIVQIKFIDPEPLGHFKSFGIVASYLAFFHLGTFDFLSRELPYLIAKGEPDKAKAFASVCFWWVRWSCIVSAGVFIVLSGFALGRSDFRSTIGWLSQLPVMWQALYGGYLAITFRTASDFARLSWITLAGAVANFLLVGFMLLSPYYGICGKTAGAALVAVVLLHCFRPLRVPATFRADMLQRAIRRGLPLFGVGYIETSLARAVEATIVLRFLGPVALGLATLVQVVQAAMLIVPSAAAQVLLPRLASTFGETHSLLRCVRITLRPTIAAFGVSLVMAFCVGVVAKPSIMALLPTYVGAVGPVVAGCVVVPLWCLRLPGAAFYAAGDLAGYGIPVIIGFAVSVLGALAAVKLGAGLVGVIVASGGGTLSRVMASGFLLRASVRAEKGIL